MDVHDIAQLLANEQIVYEQKMAALRQLEWHPLFDSDNFIQCCADEIRAEAYEVQQTVRWIASLYWTALMDHADQMREDFA